MKKFSKFLLLIVVLYFLLLIPFPSKQTDILKPSQTPFIWGLDKLWDQLEIAFKSAKEMPNKELDSIVNFMIVEIDSLYNKNQGEILNQDDPFYPHMVKENFDVLSGFLKMDACNLSGFKRDIPQIQKENIAYYTASALHMGLLGRRLDQYNKERPNNEWITNLDVDTAIKANKIAEKHNISLSRLALRFVFSIEEADRVVVGPTTKEQMDDLLGAWNEGKLPEAIFHEIKNNIVASR